MIRSGSPAGTGISAGTAGGAAGHGPGEQPRPGEPRRADRNRYADLLRLLAIALVVTGHWLLTDITFRHGQLSGRDALPVISWSGWATLFFQVMPIFFVVGGFANATSWTAHHERGESWAGWVRDRALRLLWPTAAYVAVMTAAAGAGRLAGVSPVTLAQAGWLVALQLWFLPVYLVLIALTPLTLAAHQRWGLAVPAVMAIAAAAVSVATAGPRVPVLGYANYLLVWGSMHQWGFGWQDGTLTRSRWRPYALAAGGAAALAGLLAWSPFPVNMIGNGTAVGNTTPPSIALLAFAAAQTGLILAAAPVMTRVLARARIWRPVKRLNPSIMTVYLWHMVPVVILAAALYPTKIAPQPRIGSAQWWELRPAWLVLLAVVLVALIAAVTWLERPMLRLPMGLGSVHPWTPALLLTGIAAASLAITELAISGFAPGGSLPLLILACFAGGLVLTLLSGRPESGPQQAVPGPEQPAPPAARKTAASFDPVLAPAPPLRPDSVTARVHPRPPPAVPLRRRPGRSTLMAGSCALVSPLQTPATPPRRQAPPAAMAPRGGHSEEDAYLAIVVHCLLRRRAADRGRGPATDIAMTVRRAWDPRRGLVGPCSVPVLISAVSGSLAGGRRRL